jgi:chemotaxis protein MotA
MAAKGTSFRPDLATVAGLILAVGGILYGQKLEGGSASDIFKWPAALIVLGGTIGAVMVSVPLTSLRGAAGRLKQVFFEQSRDPAAMINEIIDYATKARKSGIVSLEAEATAIQDDFLRKALTLAVDGTDLQEIRKMMELEIGVEEHRASAHAKVFEAAGGYSPTIGIIGAVLGLIQVMGNLADMKAVGHGIAGAFVATIYGVGFANLFCLPAANKIKARAYVQAEMSELILEGVVGIVEGLNPKLIRTKLEAYVHECRAPGKPIAKPAVAEAAPAKG